MIDNSLWRCFPSPAPCPFPHELRGWHDVVTPQSQSLPHILCCRLFLFFCCCFLHSPKIPSILLLPYTHHHQHHHHQEATIVGTLGRVRVHSPWWKPTGYTVSRDGAADEVVDLPHGALHVAARTP